MLGCAQRKPHRVGTGDQARTLPADQHSFGRYDRRDVRYDEATLEDVGVLVDQHHRRVMIQQAPPSPELQALRRRRRQGFLNHLIAYFAVMIVLVPVNVLITPEQPWFLLPMVGWMAPLAIHAAWVMELFGPPKVCPEALAPARLDRAPARPA